LPLFPRLLFPSSIPVSRGNFLQKGTRIGIVSRVEIQSKLREERKREVSAKQVFAVDRWEKFLEAQGGCYPATLAAVKLGMTPQGVFQASERGWITFFQLGRKRFYGAKDVILYRCERSRKRGDCALRRSPAPRKWPHN
jgi:hypothetical protein